MATSNGVNYNQTQGLKISTDNTNRVIVSTGGTTTFTGNTSGVTLVQVAGSQGELMSVKDISVGKLLHVNNLSGETFFTVNSDYSTVIGTPNVNTFVVSGNSVGINTTNPTNLFHISGTTDPIKIEGIQSYSADTSYLTINNSGVVHKKESPYKVYTALLTQSGGDDPQTITSGVVTQGFTYYIDGADIDSDFSNVGGPIGTVGDGTYFVATNSAVPNNYGAANITYNNGAPVVTVLENTIGNIWWTYDGVGQYYANSNNLFTDKKTICFTNQVSDDNASMYLYEAYRSADNYCLIVVSNGINNINDILGNGNGAGIEIRVYN